VALLASQEGLAAAAVAALPAAELLGVWFTGCASGCCMANMTAAGTAPASPAAVDATTPQQTQQLCEKVRVMMSKMDKQMHDLLCQVATTDCVQEHDVKMRHLEKVLHLNYYTQCIQQTTTS
jgi:hypothetical protein